MKNTPLSNTMNTLRRYIKKREDISMAFLFGSVAKGSWTAESDIDIGVYFIPKGRSLDCENPSARYLEEHDLWLDIERILHREIDFVVLNRAPATIADSALRGVPIVIKDKGLYLDFLLRVTRDAEDFRDFIEDYWRLKQEAK